MSIDIKLPFGPFLRLSVAEYKRSIAPAPLEAKLLDEAIDRAHTAWHAARKKKRGAPVSEEQFLASLKADPALVGVDFDKELAACQFWCRNHNPPVKCSRMRVVNWMKRAVGDATVAAPGGTASHAPKPDPGPVGWLEWARENTPGWRRFAEEAQGIPVPPWHLLQPSERHAFRTQMKPSPARA